MLLDFLPKWCQIQLLKTLKIASATSYHRSSPMKIQPSSLLFWIGLLLACAATELPAQQSPPLPVPPRRILGPNSASAEEVAPLKANYRVSLTGKSGDKSFGELSALTCSQRIDLSGPLSQEDYPATFTVSGVLQEAEGEVTFNYSIGFSIAQKVGVGESTPNQQARPVNVQWSQHRASGTLRMKPGKPYDVLKCGGNVYTISISPEPDK